jgi:hypothetical protein
MGVREEFDSIRKRLLHDSADLNMARALSDLLAEGTRLRSMSAPPMSVSHTVLAASQRYRAPPKDTSSKPCVHCGKTNDSSENCFSQHPEKLADFRARRAARAARGRGTGSTLEALCLLLLLHLSVLLNLLGFLIQVLLFM